MLELSLLTRRQLSPEKLKRARLSAQKTNVAEVARRIGIDRAAYLRWESTETPRGERLPGLTHLDFVALRNALALFGVTYEDVTDPIEVDEVAAGISDEEAAQTRKPGRPTPPQPVLPAEVPA